MNYRGKLSLLAIPSIEADHIVMKIFRSPETVIFLLLGENKSEELVFGIKLNIYNVMSCGENPLLVEFLSNLVPVCQVSATCSIRSALLILCEVGRV